MKICEATIIRVIMDNCRIDSFTEVETFDDSNKIMTQCSFSQFVYSDP